MMSSKASRFDYFRENYETKFRASLFATIAFVNLMWASTTPIGGVADEPAYAIYANVIASGQNFGDASIPEYSMRLHLHARRLIRKQLPTVNEDRDGFRPLTNRL